MRGASKEMQLAPLARTASAPVSVPQLFHELAGRSTRRLSSATRMAVDTANVVLGRSCAAASAAASAAD